MELSRESATANMWSSRRNLIRAPERDICPGTVHLGRTVNFDVLLRRSSRWIATEGGEEGGVRSCGGLRRKQPGCVTALPVVHVASPVHARGATVQIMHVLVANGDDAGGAAAQR